MEDFTLAVSNDKGSTYSNQITIGVVKTMLPQFSRLLNPNPITLQANRKHDLKIEGLNLRVPKYIGIKVQLGSYEQYSFCNVSAAEDTIATCFDLHFPKVGTYQTFIIPDMDRT